MNTTFEDYTYRSTIVLCLYKIIGKEHVYKITELCIIDRLPS